MEHAVTARDLARAIAKDPNDPNSVREAMNRVQYFDRSGLYDRAAVRIGTGNVGRGKSRAYTAEAVIWTRLFSAMIEHGFGMVDLLSARIALHENRPVLGGKGTLWARVFERGSGPDVILMLPHDKKLLPVVIAADERVPEWTAGSFINLTQALK